MVSDKQIIELLTSLQRCMIAYRRVVQEKLKTYNLTISQAKLLRVLTEEGPQSLVELSKKLETATSSISGIVDRLERMDYVYRQRDEQDRRVVRVGLTEKCEELLADFPISQSQQLQRHLTNMSSDEVRVLTELLQKFTQCLDGNTSTESQARG
ncbi:MarR family winged helix-turn-helix transcriptional regulator [Lihuaxuella thermophila]|uniref:DNA-binding transcriptional regulator, MarR family n=1 Tax=Lihuaxuella thermophila TaxID=1173111 RepID=A0A1H8J3P9_9BACL|nr:MarR family transcriptional regulator [Lihuaxuella thermophila]SEN74827.1 DNA-binding transcriptional regulator, MarR family [Lihuaxuella thermophila]